MSTLAQLAREASLPTPQVAARPIGGVRSDWTMALLSALFLGGL